MNYTRGHRAETLVLAGTGEAAGAIFGLCGGVAASGKRYKDLGNGAKTASGSGETWLRQRPTVRSVVAFPEKGSNGEADTACRSAKYAHGCGAQRTFRREVGRRCPKEPGGESGPHSPAFIRTRLALWPPVVRSKSRLTEKAGAAFILSALPLTGSQPIRSPRCTHLSPAGIPPSTRRHTRPGRAQPHSTARAAGREQS